MLLQAMEESFTTVQASLPLPSPHENATHTLTLSVPSAGGYAHRVWASRESEIYYGASQKTKFPPNKPHNKDPTEIPAPLIRGAVQQRIDRKHPKDIPLNYWREQRERTTEWLVNVSFVRYTTSAENENVQYSYYLGHTKAKDLTDFERHWWTDQILKLNAI